MRRKNNIQYNCSYWQSFFPRILLSIVFIGVSVSITYGQTIKPPLNYTVLQSVAGDLDQDGVSEMAIAYNMRKPTKEGESVPRALLIYKKRNSRWVIWKKSYQVLYGSKDGGMMGDPFGEIKIDKGILSVSHNGGSSWKWDNTDKFRFQNGEFVLIGYTSTYGKPCEYWLNVDFNLSTGKMIVKKEYEDCEKSDQEIYKSENETLYKKGIKITLENRNVKELKIVTPKYKHEVYVSIAE